MNRPDRYGEHRTAFEKNKKTILRTQKVCGICGLPVDFEYKFPHPLSPTIDHIVPIALGGHPSALENLQLAHRCCNRQKGAKLFGEGRKKEDLEKDTKIDHDDLPQHFDWAHYRCTGG